MRKNAIRRLANNQLMNDNRGSHRDKQYRYFVIHKVIHDLFKLELLPGKWHGLNRPWGAMEQPTHLRLFCCS